jgi:hypothetical protein
MATYGTKKKEESLLNLEHYPLDKRMILMACIIIIICHFSLYSNIQEKIKRGGELVQFGTALPAKALHVCLLLLLILFFLLFFLFVFSGLKHNRSHDLTSSWHSFSLLKHPARSGLQR